MAATSQHFVNSGIYANGNSTINGTLGVGAITSTDLVQSTNLASGTAGTEFVVDTSGNMTAVVDITSTGKVQSTNLASGTAGTEFVVDTSGNMTAVVDITSSGLVQSTNLASGTVGTEFVVDTNGDCTANSFTGDGSALTGITVANISNTSALSISNDGSTWTETTIPIGQAGILMCKMKTGGLADDNACVCAIVGGSSGAIYLERTAGTTSIIQLELQEGATYYEIKYVASWGTTTDTVDCNMSEFKQVIV